ncbi:hypothetical protein BDN72DRAFT_863310 [Pluteus cervinus]|uniref:Uncharacterized protein n=1 Tax=Pluteus cervinus TaxID=181527 RepID=A0ACD3A8T3_9AGAR|nr:hypothetical protein BDN72DRAFT_863310 [Pluteus cervinus]
MPADRSKSKKKKKQSKSTEESDINQTTSNVPTSKAKSAKKGKALVQEEDDSDSVEIVAESITKPVQKPGSQVLASNWVPPTPNTPSDSIAIALKEDSPTERLAGKRERKPSNGVKMILKDGFAFDDDETNYLVKKSGRTRMDQINNNVEVDQDLPTPREVLDTVLAKSPSTSKKRSRPEEDESQQTEQDKNEVTSPTPQTSTKAMKLTRMAGLNDRDIDRRTEESNMAVPPKFKGKRKSVLNSLIELDQKMFLEARKAPQVEPGQAAAADPAEIPWETTPEVEPGNDSETDNNNAPGAEDPETILAKEFKASIDEDDGNGSHEDTDDDEDMPPLTHVHDSDDEDDPVTDPRYQHKGLEAMYANLPHIPRLGQVIAWHQKNSTGEIPVGTVLMKEVFAQVPVEELSCIFKGLKFIKYGRFVNAARAPPDIYETFVPANAKNLRAKVSGVDGHAIFIMIGGVYESYIKKATQEFRDKDVHGLHLAMFPQEYRRDISVWCSIFGNLEFVGPVDENGHMRFLTRAKMDQPTSPQAGTSKMMAKGSRTTPNQRTKMFKTSYVVRRDPRSRNSNPATGAPTKNIFTFDRAYDEQVPIINGLASQKHPFDFTDDEFDDLARLPLWDGSKYGGELPSGSIVAVGYTLHTWGSLSDNISPNLIFVIALWMPNAKAHYSQDSCSGNLCLHPIFPLFLVIASLYIRTSQRIVSSHDPQIYAFNLGGGYAKLVNYVDIAPYVTTHIDLNRVPYQITLILLPTYR